MRLTPPPLINNGNENQANKLQEQLQPCLLLNASSVLGTVLKAVHGIASFNPHDRPIKQPLLSLFYR